MQVKLRSVFRNISTADVQSTDEFLLFLNHTKFCFPQRLNFSTSALNPVSSTFPDTDTKITFYHTPDNCIWGAKCYNECRNVEELQVFWSWLHLIQTNTAKHSITMGCVYSPVDAFASFKHVLLG